MPQTGRSSAFAVNTYSFTLAGPVRNCLERLAAHGFREFELMMYPGHLWPGHLNADGRRELKDFLEANGLSARTLNMPNVDLNIAAATNEMRAMTLGILRQIIQLAGALGVGGVVLGPGKANPLFPMPVSRMMDHFYAALRELVPLAEDEGTAIYIENMPFAFLPGIQEMWAAVTEYGDPRIGVVYDVANGHFVKEDVCAALRLCAPRLRVVHLSDTGQSVYRHDAVGLGTVGFRPIPGVLAEIGFTHQPVLEIIAEDGESAIVESARRLAESGWGRN